MFESFLTKAGRFGNKVADAAVSGLKWGQKAAGNVVRYGTKGLDIAKHLNPLSISATVICNLSSQMTPLTPEPSV